MRRLVVDAVLGNELRTVGVVVHQVREGVGRFVVRGVDDEAVVAACVLIPVDDLLAPVAQQVAQYAGIHLRVVVQLAKRVPGAVHLLAVQLHGCGVEAGQIALVVVVVGQVAVPEDAVVERCSAAVADGSTATARAHLGHLGPLGVVHLHARSTAHEVGILGLWVEVGHQSASGIAAGRLANDDFACTGIAQVDAELTLLVSHEELLTGARGDEVAQMGGIAMSQAGAIERGAVGIDGSGAVGNLLLAVARHITYGKRVSTLAIDGAVHCLHRAIGVCHCAGVGTRSAVQPAQGEVGTVPVVGSDVATTIISAREDGRRVLLLTAQPGNAG